MDRFRKTLQSQPATIQNWVTHLVAAIHPDQVLLFGSRARGTHRENSDFDIAVKTKSLDKKGWSRALIELDDAPLTLYPIDLLHYEELDPTYQKNIDDEGIILYG